MMALSPAEYYCPACCGQPAAGLSLGGSSTVLPAHNLGRSSTGGASTEREARRQRKTRAEARAQRHRVSSDVFFSPFCFSSFRCFVLFSKKQTGINKHNADVDTGSLALCLKTGNNDVNQASS